MLTIKEMPIGEIIPYENNPRKNDNAVDAVAESIRQFGFKVPIIVDSENIIVAGHTRLRAAEKLGIDTVPVIMADDLTEEQVAAFRLADNKTGELAEWDFDRLKEELKEIHGINMSDFGFLMDELGKAKKEAEEESQDLNKIYCPRCGELVAVENGGDEG